MNDMHSIFKNFVYACEKYSIPGDFKVTNGEVELFFDNLTNSSEIGFFYKNYNPEGLKIETGFTPIKIHSITDIEKGKTGYAYLPDNYLVFGDDVGEGKPIIAVFNDKGTSIYANYDVGQPFEIGSSFCEFISSLTKLIELVYGKYNIFDIADDEDTIKTEFIEDLRKSITPVIGKEKFLKFYDYFYG